MRWEDSNETWVDKNLERSSHAYIFMQPLSEVYSDCGEPNNNRNMNTNGMRESEVRLPWSVSEYNRVRLQAEQSKKKKANHKYSVSSTRLPKYKLEFWTLMIYSVLASHMYTEIVINELYLPEKY
jgi:hypothetical protein